MDLKSTAVKGLKNACKMMLQDLRALPDEAYATSFGGATRTVADIVYEVNLVNDHVGMVLRGEDPFEWPEGEWIHAPEEFRSKAVVIEAFEESSRKIISTLEGFTVKQIEEPFLAEGKETTRFERCQFVTLHMWYHSGQLNFIQTLRGDSKWHWS